MIFSCDSNKKLEGNWISTYTSDNINPSIKIPFRLFVSFKNNQYFIKRFKYDSPFGKDSEKGTYQYKWNKLTYNLIDSKDSTNSDVIKLINDNSLVFKGSMNSNHSKFKKLDNSLKSNINLKLIGKKFLIKSSIYSDTINFINDTTVIRSSFKTTLGMHWERSKQNGFDILFMEMDIPYLLRKKPDGKTILTGHYDDKFDLELIELE